MGAQISRASTFGLPIDVWKTTNYEYAIIPSSFFIRLKICRVLAQLRSKRPLPWFSLRLVSRLLSFLRW